jgi:hypothetical protein
MCIFVLCLTVVPLPPGKNPFAVQINNNISKNTKIETSQTDRRNVNIYSLLLVQQETFWGLQVIFINPAINMFALS